jgi:hypothetical protein
MCAVNYGFLAEIYIVAYALIGALLGLIVGWIGPPGWLPTVSATAMTVALAWLAQVLLLRIDPDGALAVLFLAALTFPVAYWLAPRRRSRSGNLESG